jgi:hypothetical protein
MGAAKAQGLNMVTSFTDIELTGRRNTTFDNAEGTRSTARGWEIDVRLPIFDWGGMQRDAMNARTWRPPTSSKPPCALRAPACAKAIRPIERPTTWRGTTAMKWCRCAR